MNTWQKKITVPLVLVGLFLLSGHRLQQITKAQSTQADTLPSLHAKALPFLSLGHYALVSDLLLARSLSFYGANRQRTDAAFFKGLPQLFAQAFTLDPDNKELILFAANTVVGIDFKAAISLLELGMQTHADYWKYPEMAGFLYYYHARDAVRAARFYERAARLPGHPPFVPSISSKLYEESGFFNQAISVLQNLADGSQDAQVKKGFSERIALIRERMRLRRFRVPVQVLQVLSATRLQLDMARFNPYTDLSKILVLDLGWRVMPMAGDQGQAVATSLWRQWQGREVWMQLQTDETGRVLTTTDGSGAVLGTLQEEGGDDLLARAVAEGVFLVSGSTAVQGNWPHLQSGAVWSEHLGQVLRMSGYFQEIRQDNEGLEILWREADMPPLRIAAQDLPNFKIADWAIWLDGLRAQKQEAVGLLGLSKSGMPTIILLHPSQLAWLNQGSSPII